MDYLKHILDGFSIAALGAWFLGMLPHFATALTVIWMGLRIYGELVDRGFIKGRAKVQK